MRQAGQSRCRRRLACRLGGLALPTCACIMLNAAPLLPAPPQVDNFEKYFVFEPQPGSLEWRILEEACAELSKLSALIDGKIKVRGRGQGVAKRRLLASGWGGTQRAGRLPALQRGLGDKKALQERMRQQVRVAIEEDKAQREVIFQAHTAPVEAQPLPPSPRSRAQAGRGGGDL